MIRDTIAKFLKLDSLISNLTGYVETRIELLKVEAKEEISKGISNVLVYVAMAFMFLLALGFLSVAVAVVIGEKLGSYFVGFSIVGGFYLLVGTIVALLREALVKKIEKKVSIMFNKKKE